MRMMIRLQAAQSPLMPRTAGDTLLDERHEEPMMRDVIHFGVILCQPPPAQRSLFDDTDKRRGRIRPRIDDAACPYTRVMGDAIDAFSAGQQISSLLRLLRHIAERV